MAVRISRDPIAERGGLNLYAMVANNPINAWDDLGEKAWAKLNGTSLTIISNYKKRLISEIKTRKKESTFIQYRGWGTFLKGCTCYEYEKHDEYTFGLDITVRNYRISYDYVQVKNIRGLPSPSDKINKYSVTGVKKVVNKKIKKLISFVEIAKDVKDLLDYKAIGVDAKPSVSYDQKVITDNGWSNKFIRSHTVFTGSYEVSSCDECPNEFHPNSDPDYDFGCDSEGFENYKGFMNATFGP